MKPLAILAAGCLAFASTLPPRSSDIGGNPAPTANVNSRYIVESVELAPASVRVGTASRNRIDSLVGGRFDQEAFNSLAGQLEAEARAEAEADAAAAVAESLAEADDDDEAAAA